uniref:Uncharacterized protein n=1 Tax=Arundo donax TaxID=35708 RepID=A0A0A9DAB2_ARUDO
MDTFTDQGPTPGMAPGGGRPILPARGLSTAGGDGLNGEAAAESFLLGISLKSILHSSKLGFDISLPTPSRLPVFVADAETTIGSILLGRASSKNSMSDFPLSSAFVDPVDSENSMAAPSVPLFVGS